MFRLQAILFSQTVLIQTILFSISMQLVLRESLNKFPDFFRMGTFIDSAHMKL